MGLPAAAFGWAVGCGSSAPDLVMAPSAAPPPAAPEVLGVPAGAASGDPAAPAAPAAIEWVEDDIDEAIAQARASKRLVVVDAWAPWCHTCLAMKGGVLRAPELVAYSDRVVFAAIDTDRPENASFMQHYEVPVWPTFFVLEPAGGEVVAMLGGAASLSELTAMIDRGLAAQEGRGDALGVLARADQLFAKGAFDGAAKAYEEAAGKLEAGPGRSAAMIGWIRSLSRARAFQRCVEVGSEHLESVTGAAAPADFSYYLRSCVNQVKDVAARKRIRERVLARLEQITASPDPHSSMDDRADALAQLADAARELGDKGRAKRADEARLALMEAAADEAETPAHAMTYDYQRAGAYLTLGRGEDAVEMLTEREKQLPDSYEPPARLAWVLSALDRDEEALAAIERAVERSYGPRRLRYLRMKADLLDDLGEPAEAIATLREVLAGLSALDGKLARPGEVAEIEKLIKAWEKKQPRP